MAADFVLEACVDSLDSALAAKEGGATRLELCANLLIGGTTPMPSLVRRVKAATGLPTHALLRPRFGDFLYTGEEFSLLLEDAAAQARYWLSRMAGALEDCACDPNLDANYAPTISATMAVVTVW